MLYLEADDVYDVAKPLHFWSKLLGLASFNIEKKNGKFNASKSAFNVFAIALSSLWIPYCGFLYIQLHDSLSKNALFIMSEVYEITVRTVMMDFFVIMALSNWWIFCSRKALCDALNFLHEVDDAFKEMKSPVDHKKHRKLIVVFIVVTKVLIFLNIWGSFQPENSVYLHVPIALSVLMCIVLELSVFTTFHFVFLMWAVKLRYQKLNSIIEDNFELQNFKLRRLASIHDKLVDVSEAINRCFGVSVSIQNSTLNCTLKLIYRR